MPTRFRREGIASCADALCRRAARSSLPFGQQLRGQTAEGAAPLYPSGSASLPAQPPIQVFQGLADGSAKSFRSALKFLD
jgi:hypothetical protein